MCPPVGEIAMDKKIAARSFKSVRDDVTSKNGLSPQEKNKSWWSSLPMTYEDWDNVRRTPETLVDFLRIEEMFLSNNPWLRDSFDFTSLAGRRVLEIGCGSGVAACLMSKHGADVVAIDLTESAVAIAQRNREVQELSFEVLCMDAEHMTFDADSFDFVFSWGVLHHSQDTCAAFREVSRVLRPGGNGMIMVYHKRSLRYYGLGLLCLLGKGYIFRGHNLATVQQLFTDGFYHRHFAKRELRDCLLGAGLSAPVVSVSDLAAHQLRFLPRALNRWIGRTFGWFVIAEFTEQ